MQTDYRNAARLDDAVRQARDWLFEYAAPIWAHAGVLEDGMFAERIRQDGTPAVEMSRRLRVQARQIYSFCVLGRLGWNGPWRACVDRAVGHMLTRGLRDDGLCVHLFGPDGEVTHAGVDLYDHAFALLALAYADGTGCDGAAAAIRMRDTMLRSWRRHPGGFIEGDITPCPPYRQNPHMHMFEAALAHRDAGGDEAWGELAQDLRALFDRAFHDPASGSVTEYFDAGWRRLPGADGERVEPGHCFEWSWLLEQGFADEDARKSSDALTGFARRYGIDPTRGVVVNAVRRDGAVIDGAARLWPQTERLKAAVIRFRRDGSLREAWEIVAAWNGLARFLNTPVSGLWYDRMEVNGGLVDEAAPASSFYHIVCALNELLGLDLSQIS